MKPQTIQASARADYADPVRKLLSLGVDRRPPESPWPHYGRLYGIGPPHVDELVRMARDPKLSQGTRKEAWAPVHAWRALGQIGAQEAIGPLVELLRIADDEDDLLHEELPKVFGMIGPASMQRLVLLLKEPDGGGSVTMTALDALREIGVRHPGSREQVVEVLVEALGPESAYDPTDRGFVVSALIHLRAVEAVGAIRSAYERGTVDETIAGDLEDVEVAMGVRGQRSTPKPNYAAGLLSNRLGTAPGSSPPASKKVGRNDPCPCGSGKKFKKCCGG